MRSFQQLIRRATSRALIVALLVPHAPMSWAASTDLADVPMYLAGRPKPNLMMAFDDSGSMDFEVSMNGTVDGSVWFNYADARTYGRLSGSSVDFNSSARTGTFNINPDNFNDRTNYKKYTYLFPNGMWVDNPTRMRRSYGSSGAASGAALPPTAEFAWARSAEYNALYYNPQVRYLPWAPHNDGASTTSFANANPAGAQHHPVFTGEATNLGATLTSNATEWTFRMYPGMILPAGASYRVCYRDNADCVATWTSAVTDACLVRNGTGLQDNDNITLKNVGACANAGAPVTTSSSTLDLAAAAYAVSGRYPNHVEASIPYYPATYYVRDSSLTASTAHGKGPDSATAWLRKVEINAANAPFAKDIGRTDCVGSTCTYAEELQNFANWFTYYRKRIMMSNASIGQAFTGVASLRAGVFRFNSLSNVTMYDVDAASDTANLRRMLHALHTTKPSGGTPTRAAMYHLGEQFKRTGTGAPITSSCQFNAGFVITDGYVSAGTAAVGVGNYDGQTNYTTYPYNRQYSATGATLANPYQDSSSETLADWAMKYYTENLRPDLPAGKVRFNTADVGPGADRNPNLHMNTYALGINLRGTIFGTPSQPANPYAATINWPVVNTGLSHQPSSIDELWHATLNGRGQMFSAATPEQTRNALLDVIDDVIGRDAAGAAVAVSNPVPVLGDNTIYYSEFRSGTWSGDLNGYPINVVTGAIDTAAQIWSPSPQKLLAARDPGTRIIATYDGSSGVAFRWASLPAELRTALTPSWLIPGNTGADVVDFLRGVRGKEGTQFRSRGPRPPFGTTVPDNVAVLGDIVNAEPTVVGAPNQQWNDAGYGAFRAAQASRPRTVYQGANNGMLHALDAATGAERWAYVPGRAFVMRQDTASSSPWPYVSALTNLGQRVGFAHRFYVDGTPVTSDVDFGCSGVACSDGARLAHVAGRGISQRGVRLLRTRRDLADTGE
jgi:type IV pilus assembly protein PilY1